MDFSEQNKVALYLTNSIDYETKKVNQAVKRNIDRFPERFCFQLTEDELLCLRSQIVTLNNEKSEVNTLNSQVVFLNEKTGRGKHRKYLPYVFTEQGIAMLSGILKSEVAVQVSIKIMDAFVEMRKFIMSNAPIFERLTNVEYKLLEHDRKFDEVFNELQKDENFSQKIFFQGQIYDAYNLIVKLIKRANKKIVIIDNYIDESILEMLSKKNKNVEVKINENDIVPAQVIKVNNKTITLKTEDNEIITVDRPKSTIKDKLFLKTMIDILRSGIWIPVNKKLKQLLRYDWFDSLEDYQFL